MSEPIYLKDADSYGVQEADKDRERLRALNIVSPTTHDKHKLKIDSHTKMYFTTTEKRDLFIKKYYNRNTKRFDFETNNTQTT